MKALFLLLVALQIADAWTTIQALKRPGNFEANKFMRKLMDAIGVKEALFFVKVAGCTVVWVCIMALVSQGQRQLAAGLLGAACALYAWVVYNNYRLLKDT